MRSGKIDAARREEHLEVNLRGGRAQPRGGPSRMELSPSLSFCLSKFPIVFCLCKLAPFSIHLRPLPSVHVHSLQLIFSLASLYPASLSVQDSF